MQWEVLFRKESLNVTFTDQVAEETAFAPFRKIRHSARYLKVHCGSLTSKPSNLRDIGMPSGGFLSKLETKDRKKVHSPYNRN